MCGHQISLEYKKILYIINDFSTEYVRYPWVEQGSEFLKTGITCQEYRIYKGGM